MHILTFLFFSLNLSSSFLDPFFPLVEMLSEPENTNTRKKEKTIILFYSVPKTKHYKSGSEEKYETKEKLFCKNHFSQLLITKIFLPRRLYVGFGS